MHRFGSIFSKESQGDRKIRQATHQARLAEELEQKERGHANIFAAGYIAGMMQEQLIHVKKESSKFQKHLNIISKNPVQKLRSLVKREVIQRVDEDDSRVIEHEFRIWRDGYMAAEERRGEMVGEENWVSPTRRDPIIGILRGVEEERVKRKTRSRPWLGRRESSRWGKYFEREGKVEGSKERRLRSLIPEEPPWNVWEDEEEVAEEPRMSVRVAERENPELISWYEDVAVRSEVRSENTGSGDIEWFDPDDTVWPESRSQVDEVCPEQDTVQRTHPITSFPEFQIENADQVGTGPPESGSEVDKEAKLIEALEPPHAKIYSFIEETDDEAERIAMKIPGGWILD